MFIFLKPFNFNLKKLEYILPTNKLKGIDFTSTTKKLSKQPSIYVIYI